MNPSTEYSEIKESRSRKALTSTRQRNYLIRLLILLFPSHYHHLKMPPSTTTIAITTLALLILSILLAPVSRVFTPLPLLRHHAWLSANPVQYTLIGITQLCFLLLVWKLLTLSPGPAPEPETAPLPQPSYGTLQPSTPPAPNPAV